MPTPTPAIAVSIDGEGHESSPHSLWSSATSDLQVLSTTAPYQTMDIYRLGSVIPPLLSAILDCVEIGNTSVEPVESYRLVRILDMISAGKVDSYLDILQVIAYHSNEARYRAYTILTSFWPESTGHVTASIPFPVVKPPFTRNSGRFKDHGNDNPFDHQFISWRYPTFNRRSNRASIVTIRDSPTHFPTQCQVCNEPINGFGLQCVLCPCAVHFMCYDTPNGSFFSQYPLAQDPGTHRVAVTRFSRILPSRREELDCICFGNHHLHSVGSVHFSPESIKTQKFI